MQDCLGQLHQAQQVAHPRVVQINLLHLDAAPRTDFHGGTRILVCWQILDQPASGMHELACVSVCIFCSVCIPFSGEVHCKMHSTYYIVCLPSTTHFNIQGNTLNAASEVDCWAGKEWTKGHLAQLQLPYQSKQTQSNPHRGLEECKAASPGKSGDSCQKINSTIRMWALVHYIRRLGWNPRYAPFWGDDNPNLNMVWINIRK